MHEAGYVKQISNRSALGHAQIIRTMLCNSEHQWCMTGMCMGTFLSSSCSLQGCQRQEGV